MTAFRVEAFSAWAPGLTEVDDWLAWLEGPVPLTASEATPALLQVSPMLRRRIERLGRVALQAAWDCQRDARDGATVFASRYGDLERSVHLLQSLAAGEPLSPTSFALSVHNAIAAQYSMSRADRGPHSAVAAGEHSAAAGLLEASALLAEGTQAVLLVYFEARLPGVFQQWVTEPVSDTQGPQQYAWACRLVSAQRDHPEAVQWQGDSQRSSTVGPWRLPAGLELLRFLLGLIPAYHHGPWNWRRNALVDAATT